MSRRTVAADRRPSHKSSSWVRRLARFKNRFPRLLRTDYWRSSSSRTLWTSLFAKPKKSKASRTTSTQRGRNQARLQMESLEERRLLTINVAVVDNAGNNDGIAATVAQLNDAVGTPFNATEISATSLNSTLATDISSHTSTYNVVIFGNDGNTSAGDQDSVFAQNLDTWAQQGRGGVIGVGWALFGSLGESGAGYHCAR